jgi:hypothetical protein
MSIGEDRVRVKFNPSADGLVDQIKQKSAELIDLLAGIPQHTSEQERLVELAATAYEEAAMWATKAATAPPLTPKRPTISDLEELLKSDAPRPMHIHPDGTVSVL